jgi:hypothetical protein
MRHAYATVLRFVIQKEKARNYEYSSDAIRTRCDASRQADKQTSKEAGKQPTPSRGSICHVGSELGVNVPGF